MSSLERNRIPVAALFTGVMVAFTSVAVVAIHQARHPAGIASAGDAVAVRRVDLKFIDAGDGVTAFGGKVRVIDNATGADLPALRPNDGFVRAVLNSLNFERFKSGITAPPVFRLVEWSDHKITIEDLATGKRVGLGQFGDRNKSVFLRFFGPAGMGS